MPTSSGKRSEKGFPLTLAALAELGAKRALGETLLCSLLDRHPGPLVPKSPTQPLSLSLSCREGDSQDCKCPLAQGTTIPLTPSHIPQPPLRAGTFCCPCHEGAVLPLGRQG